MKAPKGYIVTPKVVAKMEKEAARVKKLQAKIMELNNQLYDIQEQNRWANYLGRVSCNKLNQEENYRFADACEVVKYAYHR